MKLSIVIPVHNNFNFTKACINDLRRLPKDHEIIIVDNGSSKPDKKRKMITDRTAPYVSMLAKEMENLVYIRNDENLGFAKASNQGYAASQGEFVMFLNNDIRVKSDHETWTQPIMAAAEDGSLVGPTGGLLDENLKFLREEDKLIDSKYFYMCAWNLTAKKETWEKLKVDDCVGPFIEDWGSYFEDTDLSFRAKELNISFKILPAPVLHFGRMTGKQLGLQQLYAEAHTKFVNKWVGRI